MFPIGMKSSRDSSLNYTVLTNSGLCLYYSSTTLSYSCFPMASRGISLAYDLGFTFVLNIQCLVVIRYNNVRYDCYPWIE